ncbi:MAG: cobalamin-dependent protein [Actinomycetia bacterium]|nr:cobalamin-dependent protein [Actinomycetes bacterium]
MADITKISQLMSDLEDEQLLAALRQLVQESPADAPAALAACQTGLEAVGQRFEAGEYFLSDLIFAGEIMTDAAAILKPALAEQQTASLGKLVLCTVHGDLHDIGKNIVRTMMEAAGFEVIDLGVDVEPPAVVAAARDSGAKIVGLSSVLTLAIDSMRDTVQAFVDAGLRDQVKIIIGGNPVSETVCAYAGADAWVHNPQDGVNICREWAKA